MPIISYFRGNGGENWDEIVPKLGKQAVKKLMEDHKFEINKIDYLCVNYNSSMFREKYVKNMKQRFVRFNMVYHPYLMSYLKPGIDEEKKWVMASLYTRDNMHYGLKRSTFNPIKINSTDIFSEENWIEVHIHRVDENDPNAMAVSPNNAGVLLDLSCPVLPFYSLVVEQVDKKKINILVTHH